MENKSIDNINYYKYHYKRLMMLRIIFGTLFSISFILTLVFSILMFKSIVVTTKSSYGYSYKEYTYLESFKIYQILALSFVVVSGICGIIFSLSISCKVKKVFTHNTEVVIYVGVCKVFLYINDTLVDKKNTFFFNHRVLSANLQDGVLITVRVYMIYWFRTKFSVSFSDETKDIYI